MDMKLYEFRGNRNEITRPTQFINLKSLSKFGHRGSICVVAALQLPRRNVIISWFSISTSKSAITRLYCPISQWNAQQFRLLGRKNGKDTCLRETVQGPLLWHRTSAHLYQFNISATRAIKYIRKWMNGCSSPAATIG